MLIAVSGIYYGYIDTNEQNVRIDIEAGTTITDQLPTELIDELTALGSIADSSVAVSAGIDPQQIINTLEARIAELESQVQPSAPDPGV